MEIGSATNSEKLIFSATSLINYMLDLCEDHLNKTPTLEKGEELTVDHYAPTLSAIDQVSVILKRMADTGVDIFNDGTDHTPTTEEDIVVEKTDDDTGGEKDDQ